MGQEFCRGCQDLSLLTNKEDNLSKQKQFIGNNEPIKLNENNKYAINENFNNINFNFNSDYNINYQKKELQGLTINSKSDAFNSSRNPYKQTISNLNFAALNCVNNPTLQSTSNKNTKRNFDYNEFEYQNNIKISSVNNIKQKNGNYYDIEDDTENEMYNAKENNNVTTNNYTLKKQKNNFENNQNNFNLSESNELDNYESVQIDPEKINEIHLKYKVNLIVKAFRTLKYMKENAHKDLIQEQITLNEFFVNKIHSSSVESYRSNKENLNDINLLPCNQCFFIGSKFNGKKDGNCLLIFNDERAKLFCRFINDKPVNFCKFNVQNELRNYYFFGEITNYNVNGFGLYENREMQINYIGEWANNNRNGIGEETHKDESNYRGDFVNGKKHGIGEYKWSDGTWYQGEWLNNCLSGFGIYKFKDNSIYKGGWKNNKMDGIGEFTFPGEKTYFGFFKCDQRFGLGIVFWYKEQKAFIGFWKNNLQNGPGKLIINEKTRYGIWKEGKMFDKTKYFDNIENQMDEYQIKFKQYFYLNYDDIKEKFNQIFHIDDSCEE